MTSQLLLLISPTVAINKLKEVGEGYSEALEQLFEQKEQSVGGELEHILYFIEHFESSSDVLVLGVEYLSDDGHLLSIAFQLVLDVYQLYVYLLLVPPSRWGFRPQFTPFFHYILFLFISSLPYSSIRPSILNYTY